MAVLALTLPASAQLENANVCVVKDKDGFVVSDAVVSYKRLPDKLDVLGVPLGDGTFLFKNLEGKVQLEIAPTTLKTVAPSTVNVFIPPKQTLNRIEIRYVGSQAYARVIPLEGSDVEALGALGATANVNLNRPAKAVRPPLGPAGCVAGDGDECETPLIASDGANAGDTTDNTGAVNDSSCGGAGDVVDEWWCYTATCTGLAIADTCGSGFDTTLTVHAGCGFAELACNDDTCGLQSEISWNTTAGNQYFIRVSGFGGATGAYTLNVACQGAGGGPCPPAGDGNECDAPILVSEGTFAGDLGDNTGSTGNDSSCGGTDDTIDEWYCYSPTCDGLATVTTCLPGTQFDTTLAAYSSCGGLEIVCNDDTAGALATCSLSGLNRKSTISFAVTAGVNYLVRVSVFGDDFTMQGGFGTLYDIDFSCAAAGDSPDDCADAEVIACNSTITADNTFATTAANDPGYSCHFNGPGTQGVGTLWYQFVATHDSALVNTCSSLAPADDSLIAVYDGTCGAFVELACSEDDCNGLLSELVVQGLTVGNTYYIQLAAFSDSDRGAYELTLQCPGPEPCSVPCPPGATVEIEPDCGLPSDTVNGGCNSVPTIFGSIACGETVCGTGAFDVGLGLRDTDWYEFVLTEDSLVTWTVEAEFDLLTFIITPPCAAPDLSDPGLAEPCQQVSISACLSAGTHWVFAAPQFLGAVPCGARYTGTLTCEPCVVPPGPCDNPDSGDCFVDNGTPGCNIPECCDLICGLDPFCCDVEWDGICADEALDFCEVPAEGGCCLPDGTCQVLREDDCADAGGAFQGDGSDCSGEPPPEGLCAPGEEDAVLTINLLTDDFPGETTIEVSEKGGDVIFSAGPFLNPGTLHVFDIPVCASSCYNFTIFDAFGDGICCGFGLGSYEVLLDGNLVGSGGAFGDTDSVNNIGNGCAGGGCVAGSEDATITIGLLTDDFPGETTIEVTENGGGVVFFAGPFVDAGTLFEFDIPVCSTSCYNFTIFDAFGDGICCGFGLGAYEVLYNGGVVGSGGAFGDSETVSNIGDGCGAGGGCVAGSEDATITINLLTDDFPGETTIEVSEKDGGVVFSAGPFVDAGTLHVFDIPVCSTSCYNFTIFDAFGDGICCGFGLGSYEVLYNGNMVGSGGEFGDSDTVTNIGDGCGAGGGCVAGSEDATITINLLTDDFPGETTIEVSEKDGGVVFSAGPLADAGTLHVFDIPVCSTSCYNFTIFDAFGDGICCGFGLGSYEVLYNGNLVGGGGAFGDSDSVTNIGDGCGGGGGCVPGTEDATVTINLLTDDFPGESTIELTEKGGGTVFFAGPFADPGTLHVFDIPVCSTSCYNFTIFDAFGDGICCGFGLGSYEVLYNGNLVGSGGNFDDVDTVGDIGDGCFPFRGACCLVDGSCIATTEACCLNVGGTFAGFGTSCADNPCVILGHLDIKPGSCPNSYNRNSNGVLPVALVGEPEIDVNMVDLSTVLLSRADGIGGSIAPLDGPPGPGSHVEDVATAFEGELCDCHELTGDGVDDLSMKFDTAALVAALELDDLPPGDLVELVLTGELTDGRPFEASDCVRLVPPGTPPGLVSISSNAPGVWISLTPLDATLDGEGFANFTRSFPQTTKLTLKAPAQHVGKTFKRYVVNGVLQPLGQRSIDWTIDGDYTIEIRYGSNTGGGGTPPSSLEWFMDASNPTQVGGQP
jgi:hypothetical protein